MSSRTGLIVSFWLTRQHGEPSRHDRHDPRAALAAILAAEAALGMPPVAVPPDFPRPKRTAPDRAA